MFDKKEYSKNRKAGKRGQGEYLKPKVHPKGSVVKYTKRVKGEDIEAEYPNGLGHHARLTKQGTVFENRKESRRKFPSDPSYTKKTKK